MGKTRFVNQKLGKRKGFSERRAKGPLAAHPAYKASHVPRERRAIIMRGSNQ